MALDKGGLVTALKTAFDQVGEEDSAAAKLAIANNLANAIDAFVKTGVVNTIVETTGSASAQAGEGEGSIS